MSLNPIVVVNISRQTTAVSRAGFGIMMFLATHKVFHERIKFFSSLSEMVTEGFVSTDPAYIAAGKAFSQSPGPVQIAVGTRHANDTGVVVSTVVDSTDYSVTINAATGTATTFTYNSGIGATAESIAAGLVALIPGASGLPVTAADDLDGSFVISSNPVGSLYSVQLSTGLTMEALTASETPSAATAAIVLVDNTWYGLVMDSHVQASVEDLAAWVESNKKLYITSSSDANIVNQTAAVDSTSIAHNFNNLSYDRTAVMYHNDPATYPEAAWFGICLPTDPGSITWAFKNLSGIGAVSLTTTQSNNALAKNANTYETRGGVNITFEGKVTSGEYLDIIRGIDWLESEIEANIYSRKVNLPKIPYTNAGLAVIEAEIRSALNNAITVGLVAESPQYTITVPDAADISSADKATRTLNDVTFLAYLAGAIHKTTVNGVVTL